MSKNRGSAIIGYENGIILIRNLKHIKENQQFCMKAKT